MTQARRPCWCSIQCAGIGPERSPAACEANTRRELCLIGRSKASGADHVDRRHLVKVRPGIAWRAGIVFTRWSVWAYAVMSRHPACGVEVVMARLPAQTGAAETARSERGDLGQPRGSRSREAMIVGNESGIAVGSASSLCPVHEIAEASRCGPVGERRRSLQGPILGGAFPLPGPPRRDRRAVGHDVRGPEPDPRRHDRGRARTRNNPLTSDHSVRSLRLYRGNRVAMLRS